MGKFDGILVCSDWDGTLCVGNDIPEKNVSAIRYFQENGGSFTVCSGRYYPYIENFADKIKSNTYLISLNGAYIIHPESGDCLYEGVLSNDIFDFLDEFSKMNGLFNEMVIYIADTKESISITPAEYLLKKHDYLGKSFYKILFITDTPEKSVYIRDTVNRRDVGDLVAVRSWHVGVEILARQNTKGVAVRRVADAIKAKKIVAVGDFENDISMIESADVGYAVAGAIDSVKSVADRITVDVKEGAIAAIIADIEAEL